MDKLIEMARAGVGITIFGPRALGNYQNGWNLGAKKTDGSVHLEINEKNLDLAQAIDDLYERWVATTKGLPGLNLRQIEYQPPVEEAPPPAPRDLDKEIPF